VWVWVSGCQGVAVGVGVRVPLCHAASLSYVKSKRATPLRFDHQQGWFHRIECLARVSFSFMVQGILKSECVCYILKVSVCVTD